MSKLCGVSCNCSSNGAFAYTYLSSSNINDIRDSSIVSCEGYNSALRLSYGIVSVNKVNLTDNKCTYRAAMYCYGNPLDSNDIAISAQYCTVYQNTASTYRIIYFYCYSSS